MRARNPSYDRAAAVTTGHLGASRAGARGLDLVDGTGSTLEDVIAVTFPDAAITDLGDGAASLTFGSTGPTVVGSVSADGSPFTISSGSDFRGFPGAAWLDGPTDTIHGVGDRFLVVYYHGTTHLTGGTVVGRICTVTATSPWTYTVAAEFTIDSTNFPRCDDAVSVLDIDGTGNYHAVVALREYNGVANHTPRILICNDSSASMTSASAWTSHNFALSGHTQDYIVNRVQKLANGRFAVVWHYWNGATHAGGMAWVTDVTDWSAPTFVTINNSTNHRDEMDFEEVSAGTLYCNIRNDTTGYIESSVSTDSGDTWSAPANMFLGTHFPSWRLLTSGIGVITYADSAANHVVYRQTQAGDTDSGWGTETFLETTASHVGAYATILQLDDNHALVIYGVESTESDPVDSDLYSQVLTDTTVFGSASAGQVFVSSGDTTIGYLEDKLVAGSGISVTKNDGGADESLTIAVSNAPATSIAVTDSGGYFVGTNAETVLAELGAKRYAGEILVSDTPAGSPLVFADLLQNETQTDLLYADP